MEGPKGTVENMLNAESVPEKKPGLDQAASTEPFGYSLNRLQGWHQRTGLVEFRLDVAPGYAFHPFAVLEPGLANHQQAVWVIVGDADLEFFVLSRSRQTGENCLRSGAGQNEFEQSQHGLLPVKCWRGFSRPLRPAFPRQHERNDPAILEALCHPVPSASLAHQVNINRTGTRGTGR